MYFFVIFSITLNEKNFFLVIQLPGDEGSSYYRRKRRALVDHVTEALNRSRGPTLEGFIVVAPVLVTVAAVAWAYTWIDDIPGDSYFQLTEFFYFNQTVKMISLLAIGLLLTATVGRFVRTRRGFEAERALDSFFDSIPVVGTIYSITKVTVDTVLGGAEDFRGTVKIDLDGFRLTGFKTGNLSPDGRDVIFVPTSPNITTGFVLEVEDHRFIESDETVEDALVRILSAGFGVAEQDNLEDLEE